MPTQITVNGTLLDPRGEPRRVDLIFRPCCTPFRDGASLVTTTRPREVTSNADGTFTLDLEPGNFEVTIGKGLTDEDVVHIIVPDTGGPYAFVDLITEALGCGSSSGGPASTWGAGAFRVFKTTAQLRAYTLYDDSGAYLRLGDAAASDGLSMTYRYDASSTTADNGGSVIKPDAITHPAPGRYLQINP